MLARPKFGKWKLLRRSLAAIYEDDRTTKARLAAEIESASTEKAKHKAEAAQQAYLQSPYYDSLIPWIKEVFNQLSDNPLPESEDDWPAWLAADQSLPNLLLLHWQNRPKVSGGTAT